jgi:hypothetical protein
MSETSRSAKSQEAYERRRVAEMAERLCWRGITLEPGWPDVEIAESEPSWRAFLAEASSGTIGLVMLALHKILDPCFFGKIDESTGLQKRPVEVISQVEETCRARMIQLAEILGWPRISYSAAHIGPGEREWRQYFAYGSSGVIADAVGALERNVQGEPEKRRNILEEIGSEDDE